MSCTLEEVNGDLFSLADHGTSLVHCVSECLSMSKGIAVEFKKRFGNVAELKNQHVSIGGVATLHVDERYVYYLVTKAMYYGKPTYTSLEQSLLAMREHVDAHKVTRLAMPRIGCGLDRLNWLVVRPMIIKALSGMSHDVHVTVYAL